MAIRPTSSRPSGQVTIQMTTISLAPKALSWSIAATVDPPGGVPAAELGGERPAPSTCERLLAYLDLGNQICHKLGIGFVDEPDLEDVFLRLDYGQMGVGGDNSWGRAPLRDYRIQADAQSYRYWIRGLRAGDAPSELARQELP